MLPHWQIGPTFGEWLGPPPLLQLGYHWRCPSLAWVNYPGQETDLLFLQHLTVLTVPGSMSPTSPLSLAKLWGGEFTGVCWWGLSGKDLKTACCSAIRALSLLNSLSCSSTLSIAWRCICEREATCALWACSSSIICSTLCILASRSWAISGASSTASDWCIKLSWCAQAHGRFCSTLISVSLKEKDLKTSLWAVILSISSSDAIINTGLGKPKQIFIKNDKWINEWMCCEWQHN